MHIYMQEPPPPNPSYYYPLPLHDLLPYDPYLLPTYYLYINYYYYHHPVSFHQQ